MLIRNHLLSLTHTTLLLVYLEGVGCLVMNPAGLFQWAEEVQTIRLHLCE
ncbi:hypothetical protein ACFQ88_21780 [Paenibacillus sp. NPDC056579]|nr:hypothetical protein [Paenibacillus sp. H1-7]